MGNYISPTPGVVYQFIFLPEFEQFNGIFRLVKLMTYDEYLEDGGNLLIDFFAPNGKSEEDMEKELPNIRNSKIMKLNLPGILGTEQEISSIFAPIIYLKETPDHNVSEYKKFGIVSFIGITDDVNDLDYVRDNIIEQFEASLGIKPDPKFMHVGTVWLTDIQYQEELKKRDETIKRTINYFSENKRLQKQLSQSNTKCNRYEELAVSLQKQVDELKEIIAGGE